MAGLLLRSKVQKTKPPTKTIGLKFEQDLNALRLLLWTVPYAKYPGRRLD